MTSDAINTRNFFSGINTPEILKSYFEWCSNLYDFSRRYNKILFDASNESIGSYFGSDEKSTRPEKFIDFLSRQFDSNLHKKFREEDFS